MPTVNELISDRLQAIESSRSTLESTLHTAYNQEYYLSIQEQLHSLATQRINLTLMLQKCLTNESRRQELIVSLNMGHNERYRHYVDEEIKKIDNEQIELKRILEENDFSLNKKEPVSAMCRTLSRNPRLDNTLPNECEQIATNAINSLKARTDSVLDPLSNEEFIRQRDAINERLKFFTAKSTADFAEQINGITEQHISYSLSSSQEA